MLVMKRSFLYVFRKWRQSLTVFLILLAVSTAALTGLAVSDAADTAAANLRRQFGATFRLEIDLSNPANLQAAGASDQYTGSYYMGDVLDQEVIEEVLKTAGIADYSANVAVAANLKSGTGSYCSLVENTLNGSSLNPHMASIQGWTSLEQCPYFAEGVLETAEGLLFSGDDSGQAVISRELAEQNHLTLGDTLTLEINRQVTGFDLPPEKQECAFEIVGIFDIYGEQQISQYTGPRQMLQNWVFVDSRTLLPYLNEMLRSIGSPPMGYEKVTFRVSDPAEMEAILRDIEQNPAINWNCFKLEAEDGDYQNVKDVLNGMSRSLRMMIAALVLAGMAILVLLLAIQTKFRIKETGILLSLGLGKREILAQRMAETLLLAALAFGFSHITGSLAAGHAGNLLLTQTNERLSSQLPADSLESGMTFSSDYMDLSPVFAAPKMEELSVTILPETYAAVCLSGLLFAALSACIAGSPVMKGNPHEILLKIYS